MHLKMHCISMATFSLSDKTQQICMNPTDAIHRAWVQTQSIPSSTSTSFYHLPVHLFSKPIHSRMRTFSIVVVNAFIFCHHLFRRPVRHNRKGCDVSHTVDYLIIIITILILKVLASATTKNNL